MQGGPGSDIQHGHAVAFCPTVPSLLPVSIEEIRPPCRAGASLRMVERYATVSAEHRANTMQKLGNSWATAGGRSKKF
jgi:hypothetical protein